MGQPHARSGLFCVSSDLYPLPPLLFSSIMKNNGVSIQSIHSFWLAVQTYIPYHAWNAIVSLPMFFPYNRQSTYKPITILLIFFTNNCYRSLHMNITWTYNWLQSIFESINRWMITALGNLARNATFSMNGWCTTIEYFLYKCCLTFALICSSTTNWISAHLRWKVHGKKFPKASSHRNKKRTSINKNLWK